MDTPRAPLTEDALIDDPDLFQEEAKTEGKKIKGWKNSEVIDEEKLQELVRKDKQVRLAVRAARVVGQKIKEHKVENPYEGLTPQSRAFWGAAPGLKRNVQKYEAVLAKQAKEEADDEAAGPAGVAKRKRDQLEAAHADEQSLADLREEIKRKRVIMADKQAILQKFSEKEVELKEKDEQQEEVSKERRSKLEQVRYEAATVQGKLNSLDLYFSYRHEDMKREHQKKVSTLQKTRALLQEEMASLLNECRDLRRLGAGESAPQSPTSSRGLK